MPRFLAPITVAQEYVTTNETISGSETIFGVTSGRASYWDSVSVLSGLSAKSGTFTNSVSASSFYGDGSHLTDVRDTTKLPLSGGTLTGNLTAVDAYFTNSIYSPHISGGVHYGDGSLLTGVAKLFSPDFLGIPTAPTAAAQTNTTQIATTQFVIANRGDKYLTTSSTSLALANNATYSLTAGAGLSYITSSPVTLVYDSTHYMTAVVLTYNSSTGAMTINSTNRTGIGTFSAWTVNAGAVPVVGGLLAGNNLSDVASTSASLINLGGFPRTGGALTGGLTATVGKFEDIIFIPSASAPSYEQGKLFYDSVADSICYYNLTTNNKVHVGQEIQQQVKNSTNSTIPKGTPVYITGAFGEYAGIAPAKADSLATSILIGVTNQEILSGQIGFVVTAGTIIDIDTSLFTAGNDMYLSPLSAGKMTSVLPTNPNFAIQVGVCVYSHPINGKMVVQNSYIGTLASTIIGAISIEQGGTGQTSASAALSALGGINALSADKNPYLSTNLHLSGYKILDGVNNGNELSLYSGANLNSLRDNEVKLNVGGSGSIDKSWKFANYGYGFIEVPTNSLIMGGSYGGSQVVFGDQLVIQQIRDWGVFIKTGANGDVYNTWSFSTDGTLTIPTTGKIVTTGGNSDNWNTSYSVASNYQTVSSTYVTLTGTQTLKNKTVVDWMTLVRGYNTTPTLCATIVTGDVYTYIYNSTPSNITYYRYIATDGSIDAFYTYFSGAALSGLVASKSITL